MKIMKSMLSVAVLAALSVTAFSAMAKHEQVPDHSGYATAYVVAGSSFPVSHDQKEKKQYQEEKYLAALQDASRRTSLRPAVHFIYKRYPEASKALYVSQKVRVAVYHDGIAKRHYRRDPHGTFLEA